MVKAVILAAGRGKRIAPLTDTKPKPLLHIFGRPLIERSIDVLKESGINECVIVTGYMAGAIRNHLGKGERYGVKISYVHNPAYEDGNGLSLYSAKKLLKGNGPFIVLMADHLIDSQIVRKALENVEKEPLLCVDHTPSYRPQLKDATRVLVNGEGFIKDIGKSIPKWNCVDAGVLILDKRVFEAIESMGCESNLSLSNCIKQMVGMRVPVWTCDISGLFWLDIDFPEDVAFAEKLLAERRQNA